MKKRRLIILAFILAMMGTLIIAVIQQNWRLKIPANEIIVVNSASHSITRYPGSADGNVSPLRTISSPDLHSPYGIAVDGADQIYVSDFNENSLLVFAAGSSGNAVTPTRKVQGPATHLNEPMGLAVLSILVPRSPPEGVPQ